VKLGQQERQKKGEVIVSNWVVEQKTGSRSCQLNPEQGLIAAVCRDRSPRQMPNSR
jgi:hypothetical protein